MEKRQTLSGLLMAKDAYKYLTSDTNTKEAKKAENTDNMELDLSAWDGPSDDSHMPHVVKFDTTSVSGDSHYHQILFKTKLDAELCAAVLHGEDDGEPRPNVPQDITIERYYAEKPMTFVEWEKSR